MNCSHQQNVVYSYGGILFSHKKEWNTNTLQHEVSILLRERRQNTKGHILRDSIYMTQAANPQG
jgi:hypothetical protein